MIDLIIAAILVFPMMLIVLLPIALVVFAIWFICG